MIARLLKKRVGWLAALFIGEMLTATAMGYFEKEIARAVVLALFVVVGLIAQTRRRTVCGILLGAGLERLWHHSRAHRFFSTARWCADQVGLVLADVVVVCLLPAGSPITVVTPNTGDRFRSVTVSPSETVWDDSA